MALTPDGNRTGRAAVTDRRDTIEYIRAAQSKESQKIREDRERQQNEAIVRCIELEGEEAFMKWYMDDQNVPNFGGIVERISLLRAHIAGLEFNKKYTQVDALIGDECANILAIADVADTMPEEE